MTCSAVLRVCGRVAAASSLGTFLTVLCGCAGLSPAPSRVVLFASNGAARARIVVPDGPADRVQRAATELADYLERSTGAGFEVVEESAAGKQTRRMSTLAGQPSREGLTWDWIRLTRTGSC